MDEQWDADDFEPNVVVPHATTAANKWEGEDEDDEVKESWEDEEEEKKDIEKNIEKNIEGKPKSKLKKIIAEKEKRHLEELQSKQKEQLEEMTPEEKLAEKLRQQKLQEESDLELAKETFGITDKISGIDGMNPSTREEFTELGEVLSKKLNAYAKNPEFPAFAEDLIRNICVSLNSTDLKKLKTTIDNMYLEKQKVEKGDRSKKNKGKGKAKLNMDGDNAHLNEYSAYGVYGVTYDDVYDDAYEDFM